LRRGIGFQAPADHLLALLDAPLTNVPACAARRLTIRARGTERHCPTRLRWEESSGISKLSGAQ
jgi:hypothetical protein